MGGPSYLLKWDISYYARPWLQFFPIFVTKNLIGKMGALKFEAYLYLKRFLVVNYQIYARVHTEGIVESFISSNVSTILLEDYGYIYLQFPLIIPTLIPA